MKKVILSLFAVLILSVPCFSSSWWERTFGTNPNIESNVIYAPNFLLNSTYGDMESVIKVFRINENPINLSAIYVPSTDIGGLSLGYDLTNVPENVIDTSLLGLFDITPSIGIAYDGSINKASLTFGLRIIKIQLK